MEENNKYIKEVEKLVDYYQFPSDAPSSIFAEGYNLTFFISHYLTRLTDATKPNYSQLEECKEFVHFLTLCKGGEITMSGKITTDAFGDIKNTIKTLKMNNWNFLSVLQAIASFEADRLERLFDKNCTQKEEKLSGNKLLGKYADELLFYIEGFDLGEITMTTKYNFIFDTLLLAGITGKKNISDSQEKEREKYQAVRNWINAYKTHENKQKD